MPRAWACSSARQTSIAIAIARSISSRRPAQSSSTPCRSPPPTYSLTMNGTPAVLARVEDADDVRVLAELAHRLRLAAGAGEHGLGDALGVEDGDRDLALGVLGVAGR